MLYLKLKSKINDHHQTSKTMTIRLTSKDGKLNASFTEMDKPILALYFSGNSERNMNAFEFDLEQFESSFKPIQLSDEAEKYLIKLYGTTSQLKSIVIELTERECNVFEVVRQIVSSEKKVTAMGTTYTESEWEYQLQLKQTVTPEKLIEVNHDELWDDITDIINGALELNEIKLTELKSTYTITKNG